MRKFAIILLLSAITVLNAALVLAGPGPLESCDVCTCASGEIACVASENGGEVIEEQSVVCGIACGAIGSTHGSREHFDVACSELAQCNGLSAPAVGTTWLAVAALGLLTLGSLTVRRMRGRSVA
jgi:hypothetical protein